MANAKTDNRPDKTEPAECGTKPAQENTYASGDSPKPHGDKLQHAVDEAAKK